MQWGNVSLFCQFISPETDQIVKQQPVQEDIAATDFAQQNTFGDRVQKMRIVPGKCATAPEQNTQNEVTETSQATIE
jgi:hypothetical protein